MIRLQLDGDLMPSSEEKEPMGERVPEVSTILRTEPLRSENACRDTHHQPYQLMLWSYTAYNHNSLWFILIPTTSKWDFKSITEKNSCSHHSRVEAPKAQGVHQSFGAGAPLAALGSCKKSLSVRQVLLGGPHVALLEGHTVIICKPVHIHEKKIK